MQISIRHPQVLTLMIVLVVFVFMAGCGEDELQLNQDGPIDSLVTTASATSVSCSSCKYVVPANATVVDGKVLGIKPGDKICFNAAMKYTNSITLKNIVGTATAPVVLTNCGGPVNLVVSSRPFNLKTSNSKYFRITGGSEDNVYGIRLSGSTSNGLVLCELSSDFEIDHIEVYNVGFAGIMAKTDPTCDNSTNRGYFTMKNVSIHHNYVHHTGGEGMYIGHTFYEGYTLSCGVKLPHLIEGLRVFRNKVISAGWDGIQVSSAPKDVAIYGNSIENAGAKLKADQNYSIILGGGTGGSCYGNFVKGGSGTGIVAFGRGDNILHNNVIVNVAKTGIFCDERTTTFGSGYRVLNNTIINPKEVGIRIYSEKVPSNVVINNIVVNPGMYATYGQSAFIMKLNSVTNLQMSNNYTTRTISDARFVDASSFNYRLTGSSPVINKGKSISTYNIVTDFYGGARLKGAYYDIGAAEY
jgi:hypothetical protein